MSASVSSFFLCFFTVSVKAVVWPEINGVCLFYHRFYVLISAFFFYILLHCN